VQKLNKKANLNLIFGYIFFSFGLISAAYGILAVIISAIFGYIGIILQAKDVLFELVFIVLGFLLIRNEKLRFKKRKVNK